MEKKMNGPSFCLLFVFCSLLATPVTPNCPAEAPCLCDDEVIHCDEPALTINHITFDEIPPLSKSDGEWKLLNFSYNFIHAVHDGPFVNLTKIEKIDLSHNVIDDVAINGFIGIIGIKELDLSFNKIVKFPSQAVLSMSSINKLDLGDNLIRTIDGNAVNYIKTAIEADKKMQLNLKGNPIHCDCYLIDFVKLLKANYKNFGNPHDLKCVTPPELEGHVLGALVEEELICYATLVPPTENPDIIFPPACPAPHPCWCDFLGNIFCSKGDMLSNTTFHEVPRIHDLTNYVWSWLHLSSHKIKKVDALAFFPVRVKRISLTNNQIETISEGAFFGTEVYLDTLLLEGNKLSTIPEPVLLLHKLNVLDLSLNDIYIIEEEKVKELHHLVYPDIMGEVQHRNFFAKFGRNAFNCTCEMWFFAEFVKFNPHMFQDLHFMFCVHAMPGVTSYKRLDELTRDDFPGCKNLPIPPPEPSIGPPPVIQCPAEHPCWCTYNGDIICSANLLLPTDCPTGRCNSTPPLTEVPKWIDVKKPILHSGLYLDSNRIATIGSKAFKGVRTMKIDLSNNGIHFIDSEAFEGLENDLEEVILTMNYLVEVPEGLFPMRLMETMDLSFNHIPSYHKENVEKMQEWRIKWVHNGTHLEKTDQRKGIQMRVGSNQLVCDRELCALRQWVIEEPWDFVDENEIWCALPNELWGKKLHEVDAEKMGCDPKQNKIEDLSGQLESANTARHTLAGLFAFTFLVCLVMGAYLFYLQRYKVKASPIPVQFKNPLSSDKQNGKDQKYLVEGNVYDEVDKGKMEAPVISQTFDNLGESL